MKELNIQADQNSLENDADMVIVNGEVFTYKNTGLTRRVFVNKEKTHVIKVPVGKTGQHFNDEEAEIWDAANEDRRKEYASTEKLPNGYIKQEFLHTLDDPETEAWLGRNLTMAEVRFARSCKEDVGFDKDGNLKVYDLHEYKKY